MVSEKDSAGLDRGDSGRKPKTTKPSATVRQQSRISAKVGKNVEAKIVEAKNVEAKNVETKNVETKTSALDVTGTTRQANGVDSGAGNREQPRAQAPSTASTSTRRTDRAPDRVRSKKLPTHSPIDAVVKAISFTRAGLNVMEKMLSVQASGEKLEYSSYFSDALSTLARSSGHWLTRPDLFAGRIAKLQRTLVEGSLTPLSSETIADKRFSATEWNNPMSIAMLRVYLAISKWLPEVALGTPGMSERDQRKVRFYMLQIVNMMSPANYLATNPVAIRKTIESGGANLVNGLNLLAEDLERSGGALSVRQTDVSAFKLGENLATTPGQVVFRNQLLELIQYDALTDEVHERPLLVVPPWINRYYILDLNERKSMVRWYSEQGFTTFCISWKNPTAADADLGWPEYMAALEEALDACLEITGADQANCLGYCVGGTLLSCVLARHAANEQTKIASAGLMAAQVDFEQAGELLLYTDDDLLTALKDDMDREGYLDGRKMASAFTLLRVNDLFWSNFVDCYLLGNQPRPFDLLAWNMDSTRVTRACQTFYLDSFYRDNLLSKGELTIDGVNLDLGRISTPIYCLATIDDHISPPKSVVKGSELFGGEKRVVIGGSGHIAGVVNAPSGNKYFYHAFETHGAETRGAETHGAETHGAELTSKNFDSWLMTSPRHEGSWWPDYARWLRKRAGELRVAPKTTGSKRHKRLESAPGSYVKER